jgi:transcriptional regulator with XRE-family HTH domain
MSAMPSPTGTAFGLICRGRRADLDQTQAAIAGALGISRSRYAEIESGHAHPTTAMMDRIVEALGLRLHLTASAVVVTVRRPRDAVHARCSAYVARRFRAAGWLVLRELEIHDGRFHGWVDLVAFDPRTRRLLVIEIKTSIDDIGRLERQLGWYERGVLRAIPADWRSDHIGSWLLALATTEVDASLAAHRAVFDEVFPIRAGEMRAVVTGSGDLESGRGVALIDPRSRRREWLMPTRIDGRRAPAPYQDRATAAQAMPG